MTTWMIRADDGKLLPTFLEDGIVAIGWHEIGNPAELSEKSDYLAALKPAFPEISDQALSVWAGIIRRFWHEIEVGDNVITFDPDNRIYYYGTIKSVARHEGARDEWPNIREVDWSDKIPRGGLTPWARRKLGSIVTMFKVKEAAAKEIAACAAGEPLPRPPLEIQLHAKQEFPGLFSEYVETYVNTEEGARHLALYDSCRKGGQRNFENVLTAREQGQDITDLVLDTLLPYANTSDNRSSGRWISLAPVYKGPARNKHEGAGWQQVEDWPEATAAIVNFLRSCHGEPDDYESACLKLGANPLAKGFQSAVLSPILSAIRPEVYHLHNQKTRLTLNYFFGQQFDRSIAAYPAANEALDLVVEELDESLVLADNSDVPKGDLFDMFCHWLVAVKEYDFDRRYWIIRPGRDGENWSECARDGVVRVDYAKLGNVAEQDHDDFVRRCKENSAEYPIPQFRLRHLWRLRRIKSGDGIIAYRDPHSVLGVGEAKSTYHYDAGRDDAHRLDVNWEMTDGVELQSVTWHSPVKMVDQAVFHRARQACVGADLRPFSETAFELLGQLEESPKFETYAQLKEQLEEEVKNPLRSLFESSLAVAPEELLDGLEIEQNILSRFPKNDFGRGGVWPFLWVAAYPKGGSRLVGPQFYLSIEARRLRYGLYVSSADEEALKKLQERGALDQHGQAFAGLDGLGLKVEIDDDLEAISLEEWLSAPRGKFASFGVELAASQVLHLSAKALAKDIATAYSALHPVYLLATSAVLNGSSNIAEPNQEYSLIEMAAETGFGEDELQTWAEAIDRKMQAILYGPPGTGKTYIAHRLAKHLVAGGDGIVQVVQFHPAYAYEDFIQGLRPVARGDGSLSYQVVPGRFLEFCEKARGRDGVSVLIVDEINRADLARVFGELMYLLEYRDQAIPLAGGAKPFKIPANVRIIGTMNTADRSIALVDHALRRRFAFLPLRPRYEILESFHDQSAFPATALQEVLQKINAAIGDPNYHLGISYFLVIDLDRDSLETIWRQEIEPYLEELFFDQPAKIDKVRWKVVAKEIWE